MRNRVNQREDRERKKAAAFLNQPAAQDENQCLTPRSHERPKSIDETFLIKTITDLALVGSSADSH